MNKIIRPTYYNYYGAARVYGFVEIDFRDGRLSMHGVIGPKRNGDCYGSAGQCVDEIRNGNPDTGWTPEMIERLCSIWETWHLNDLRPYCEHQKALGWDKLAEQEVTLYNYELKNDLFAAQRVLKQTILNTIKCGRPFTPTEDQVYLLNLPLSKQTPQPIDDPNYKPKTQLYAGDVAATETVKLGWTRQDKHPDGLLCKPCPVCGYKYGTAWRAEEVPQEVVRWLINLPSSPTQPAWI